jgi:hypothetical protein
VPNALVTPAAAAVPTASVRDLMLRVTGIDIDRCPVCQQGRLRLVDVLPPAPLPWDTS